MESDAKPTGRTDEEELPSVLSVIKEKLRPLLLRKWRRSRASLVAEAMEAGLDDEQLELVLRGFRRGYWTGAVDVSSVKSTDLLPDRAPTKSKIH